MSSLKIPENATQAQEQAYIDYETHKFLDRVNKFNKQSKHIRVKNVKITYDEPAPVTGGMFLDKVKDFFARKKKV